jgi:hypothetical protein
MKTRKKVEQGDYGPVRAWAGEHKGKEGYYDDDEDRMAVVYFGTPFLTGYNLVQRRWLEPIESFEKLDNLVDQDPALAEIMGIPSRRTG